MKIHIAQLNPTIGDIRGNGKKVVDAIDRARKEGSDVIVCPELTLCGYPPEDLVYHEKFLSVQEEVLDSIVPYTEGVMVLIGLVRRNRYQGEKHLLNTCAIIQDGHLVGFYDKCLLPTYDVFDERRYFEPGTGVRVWPWKGKKVGIVICEDIWQHAGFIDLTRYKRDPILELKPHDPDVLVNLTASPFSFQKPDIRVQVCAKAAKTLDCPVFLCCQVGANSELLFDGGSIAVDKHGTLIGLGKSFEEDHLVIDIDSHDGFLPPPYDPIQEVYDALVMGVKDYFLKCGFERACIGISGGIDSALVASIACDALGNENVIGIMMPSEYTSKQSVKDAQMLSQLLGFTLKEISITEPFVTCKSVLEPLFEGRAEDITEENMQARIRGLYLMAYANKFGCLALATGNKSELALGYSTLYGDMCGGLGVISDVKKTMVYEICRHLNKTSERIPQAIIDRAPTAELRPNQLDLDSLPDYGIVDQVLEGYVEDALCKSEIVEKYGIPFEIVDDLIRRIHKNEFKRRQAAPILRVTKKSFGVGRRYPLVQGWE